MSTLRPECSSSTHPAVPDDTAIFLIARAVARRRGLIHGRLHDGKGGYCALGTLWADNPRLALNTLLIEEVATVNDSVPQTATPKQRWQTVMSWLRWKKRVLATGKA